MRDCDVQHAAGAVDPRGLIKNSALQNNRKNFLKLMGCIKFAGCSVENSNSDFADRRDGCGTRLSTTLTNH